MLLLSNQSRFVVMAIVIAISISFVGVVDAQEASRTWTSSDGKKIEATLKDVNGDKITLVRADGKAFTIPLARLSDADQAYAKQATSPAPAESAIEPAAAAAAESAAMPAAEPMTPERYQQLLLDLADPALIGVNLVNDSVVQLAPFVQIDMAAEAENFIWRKAAVQPPLFVADGVDGHMGERLVFKVLPKLPAETSNKVEFNALVQLLQEAKFENLKATPIESLNDGGSQYQFHVSGKSPEGAEQYFYTYIVYLADRIFVFQSSASTDERSTEIIRIAPTAQLLVAPPSGNVPDAIRQELEQVIANMQASLEGDESGESTLQLLMSDEFITQMKGDSNQWEQMIAAYESKIKPKLTAGLAKIDFSKAIYDETKSQVTFPIDRPPLVFAKVAGRWSIQN
ncbi:SHD1 domain-containing protein [Novipirellula sp. SH528]|uniref:SHD1 domain-containing protein n=1 Tax=Novipirellula sp. SH528 TaxID=3454466 RepID=UPI003F9EDD05